MKSNFDIYLQIWIMLNSFLIGRLPVAMAAISKIQLHGFVRNRPFQINIGKLRKIRSWHGSHNIIYPLRSVHNLAYDNMNSVSGEWVCYYEIYVFGFYRKFSIWKGLWTHISSTKSIVNMQHFLFELRLLPCLPNNRPCIITMATIS